MAVVKFEMPSVTEEGKLDRVRSRRALCVAGTGQTKA